jgi:ankyrin repeat protein
VCHGGPNSEEIPRKKYLGVLQHLMDLGFDPNTPNASLTSRLYRPGRLLYIACWQASCEIVECLLKHGAIIQNSRAMRSASENGRIDVLKVLLKYGGDVNEVAGKKDINGPSGAPLHVAAAAGKEDVVRWLLAHGADITIKNCEGRTGKNILEEKGMAITSDNN